MARGTGCPTAGEVLIFFSRLDREPALVDEGLSILSAGEMERAARLPDGPARSRFVAGRIFLRKTLAPLLGINGGEILFAEGRWGKPCLSPAMGNRGLTFNLAHSADLAILAVGGGEEVGVDLEMIKEGIPFRRMAGMFFSSNELREMESIPESDQLMAFYRLWTRKEAYLKGSGTGLFTRPDSIDITLSPGFPPLLLADRSVQSGKGRWSIRDITAPKGFCAALAVEAEAPVIRYKTR